MHDSDGNKRTVIAYCRELIDERRPAQAVERYVSPDIRQHNPNAADGAGAIVEFFTAFEAENPEALLDIKRVIAEGDLVVTHSLFRRSPEDRGMAAVDIYRLRDGKIVEHWDVIQPVPETAANDNTMF